MAQQADTQKRLEYMNQVVQNSSLNAQCILGNNKRELQDIFILQTKIIHHSSVPKGRGRGISDLAAVVMHHQVMTETYYQSML